MSSTQHRCVFVGNIPYDATEEELIRICEEVGPVVSFRLVIDRDTGKPKGYGFCEYRDEETALSARRNLQGYEINGRQLRVDFAENEKGSADRNREQVKGRGGPGLVDLSKQSGGPKGVRDASLYQPVGLPAAVSAAAVMASLLGAPQLSAGSIAQMGVGRPPPPGIDALTIHLAGMSKYQLYDVLNHMKNFIQQNQQQARQILTSNPQFVKALFQVQIILGWVPQVPLQALQHQGLQQASIMPRQQGQVQQPLGNSQLQQGVQPQAQRVPNFPFPMPAPSQQQMNARTGPMLISQQPLPPPPSSLGLPPLNLSMQRSQPQLPLHVNPPPLPQQLRPMLPPSPPRAQVSGLQPPLSQLANLPQIQQPNGLPSNMSFMGVPPPLPNLPHPHLLQAPRPMGDVGGNGSISQGGLPSSGGLLLPTSGGMSQFARGTGTELPPTSAPYANWNQMPASSGPIVGAPLVATTMPAVSMPMNLGHTNMISSNNQQGGLRGATFDGSGVVQSQEYNLPTMQPPIQQPLTQQLHSQQLPSQPVVSQQLPSQQPASQQQSQVSLEPEQQKALLQQVMNLTPEQINSLPPEQRQQVLDLQQAFRSQII